MWSAVKQSSVKQDLPYNFLRFCLWPLYFLRRCCWSFRTNSLSLIFSFVHGLDLLHPPASRSSSAHCQRNPFHVTPPKTDPPPPPPALPLALSYLPPSRMEVPPRAGTLLWALLCPQAAWTASGSRVSPQPPWWMAVVLYTVHWHLLLRHFCWRKFFFFKPGVAYPLDFLEFPFSFGVWVASKSCYHQSCSHHHRSFCEVAKAAPFRSQLCSIPSSSSFLLGFERHSTRGICKGHGGGEEIPDLQRGPCPGPSPSAWLRFCFCISQTFFL